MPKPFLCLLSAFLLAAFVSAGRADTVTLKSGEKLEGKITEETATEVHMSVQETATIFDDRVIPKADIEKIEKTALDVAAWAVLKTFQLGANSLPVDQYDRFIAPLKQFVTKYPESTHIEEAKKALAAFEEEKKRIDGKELKLDGKWLSKDEAEAERYQINGLVTLNYMKSELARRDTIGALNAFDVLEKRFPNSKSYPEGVDLAIKTLNVLKPQAAARLTQLQAEKATYEKAIAAAVEPARKQMRDAAVQESAANDKALADASKQGLKWPPYLPNSGNALRVIGDRAAGELNRLSAIDLTKMRESVQAAEEAKQQLLAKDLTAADASLNKARSLWEPNEMVARLRADLDAAKTAAAAVAAKPKATPVPISEEAITKNANAPITPDEAPPGNPWLKIVLGGIIAIMVIVGVSIYRNISKKANEVLE